ncbi:alpha/beta fold hydrolase [Kitasatospora sp. NPDC094019]|uniref:alpha/beta fold hydrolase n=1 Tax=Kitasatospora sp. NPDC094019 TaxID=3364091 RepID=UPI0037FB2066
MPRFTTTDDVGLHYYDEGDGRPVVLIPGYGASADDWALQWGALRASGYRVVSLDRRWAGSSDRPPYGLRMARGGKDVQELLGHLDLTDVLLVGQSMGAGHIWAYAGLFGCERLAGIVTVDQSPCMVNRPDWEYGFYGLTMANLGTFFLDPANVLGTGHGRAWPDPAELDARIRAAGGKGAGSDITPDTYPLMFDHACQDWRDVVARITVPALILAGAESQFWPAEHAAATAGLSPLASSAVVPGAGHPAHTDAPDEVNGLLLGFASSLR